MKHADSLPPVPQYRGDAFAQSEIHDIYFPASLRATLAEATEPPDEALVDVVRAIALKDAKISAGVVRKWLEEE